MNNTCTLLLNYYLAVQCCTSHLAKSTFCVIVVFWIANAFGVKTLNVKHQSYLSVT